jgi:hypothetical protein
MAACWKEQICVACGGTFRCRLAATDSTGLLPCPACGTCQPDTIGSVQATGHGCLVVILFVLLAVLVTGIILQSFDVFWVLPHFLVPWIAMGLCLLAALGHIALARRNFNRDLEANRREAEEAIKKNTLVLVQSGQRPQPAPDPIRQRMGVGRSIAFALLLVGTAAAGSAEIVRLGARWPLNSACDPVVIGPGDTAFVYLPDKVTSIKRLWNGRASVSLINAQELGQAQFLQAEGKKDSWSRLIWGKDTKPHDTWLWAQVTVPEDAALAGKQLNLRITLDVKYPASQGALSFQDQYQTFGHTAVVNLASSHAGLYYLVLWWGGGAAGGMLVLLSGLLLRWLAKRRLSEAPPAKIIPIDGDAVPIQIDP